MRKRNRNTGGAKHIDLVSPVHEVPEDLTSSHRTCWKHVAAFLHSRKKKISKEKFSAIQLSAPCFSDNYPHCHRSERKWKCKYATSKMNKKLDSQAFSVYIERMWRNFSEDKRTSFEYMDCLWYSLYRTEGLRTRVLSWIKRKKIFSKKYVFVPIVCWGHWNLLIFCNFGENSHSKTTRPCMLLLDSLHTADPRRFEPDIRKFVGDIYEAEGRPETIKVISKIPLFVPKVPQQKNGEECGKFVLFFISLFMENAPTNFSVKEYPYFMVHDWFPYEHLESFCQTLDTLNN